eukprot:TRINITY_DN347_c0_g2_i1.p1 TRINITY_DN347_c0_g2~~TRINITY_DN347_c0_g2_i1.p1  ORF type:complete len:227 (-),score=33.97 TRINITY_DN347_c0_g2_i1:239-919(-)
MVSPVYFYIPNIIGYLRVLLLVAAFYVAESSYVLFFFYYLLSVVLDCVDGYAARAYGQSSRYGAVLDMITDRCTTSCISIILSRFYPDFTSFFLLQVALDITSHYAHLYSSLSQNKKSHKDTTDRDYKLLQLYYNNRTLLGALCLMNELFFLGLYLCHFVSGFNIPLLNVGVWPFLTVVGAGPGMAVKQFMNLVQLHQAMIDIVYIDETVPMKQKTQVPPTNNKKN